MNEHRTLASLVKDTLARYIAERRARGEPPEGRIDGLWIHLAFAFIVVAILYFLFA